MTNKDKAAIAEVEVLKKIKEVLEAGDMASSLELEKDELALVKAFNLLTLKPMIYVANMSDEEIGEPMFACHQGRDRRDKGCNR